MHPSFPLEWRGFFFFFFVDFSFPFPTVCSFRIPPWARFFPPFFGATLYFSFFPLAAFYYLSSGLFFLWLLFVVFLKPLQGVLFFVSQLSDCGANLWSFDHPVIHLFCCHLAVRFCSPFPSWTHFKLSRDRGPPQIPPNQK